MGLVLRYQWVVLRTAVVPASVSTLQNADSATDTSAGMRDCRLVRSMCSTSYLHLADYGNSDQSRNHPLI